MKTTLDTFRPTALNRERIAELEGIMAKAAAILKHTAFEVYDNTDPRFVRQLRNDWKTGKLTLAYNPRAANAMRSMVQIEAEVLSAFIKCATQLCRSYYIANRHKVVGLNIDELFSEASVVIYDSMYTYNGQNNFTTYIYWCIKNYFIGYFRQKNVHDMPDQRVEYNEERAKNIPEAQDEDISEMSDLESLLNLVELTPNEKEVVKWIKTGDKDWRDKMIENTINPRTQEKISKAWVSAGYVSLQQKLREAYASQDAYTLRAA